ncbi:MAG: ABC transporter permease [Opitutaceae bacterium]
MPWCASTPFALLTPGSKDLTFDANTQLMLQDIAVVAMCAIGMTLVIIAGGIDLSAGSTIALAMITTAYVLNLGPGARVVRSSPHLMPVLVVLAAMTVAGVVGLINGLLVTRSAWCLSSSPSAPCKWPAAPAKLVANEQNIYPPPTWSANLDCPPARSGAHGVHVSVSPNRGLAGGGLRGACGPFLRYTRLGRHTFAVGSNEKTAILCGVPGRSTKLAVYLISGLFSGRLASFSSRLGGIGQPTEAIGYELFVIAAAVVIGGASLLGGRGTVLGTMIGALIITILRNGGVKWLAAVHAGNCHGGGDRSGRGHRQPAEPPLT